jgi:hypothetical protein
MKIKNLTSDYSQYINDVACYVINDLGEKWIPEDNIICKIHKGVLEHQYGIKFAPVEIADRFSIEYDYGSGWLGKCLGFHGKHGVAEHYGVKL